LHISKNTAHIRLFDRSSAIYGALFAVQAFLGVLAASFDAVRSEIMYLAYPAISIIGARLVLKEKYTLRQNVCIWLLVLSAVAFCVIDYIAV